jgi:NAD(P)-dependent dehydrogenase (short-subunit alcohol dehydrogenase family)
VARADDADAAATVVRDTIDEFGRLDILVNNAGTNVHAGELTTLEVSQAQKMLGVNVLGPLAWARHACDGWMRGHGGVVVNVSSIGASTVAPGTGFYNATKAALECVTRQLAWELAPHVRVLAVAPGIVRTDMSKPYWDAEGVDPADVVPLARFGEPDDVAALITFLVSGRASWLTGQTFMIDGGILSQPPAGSSG